LRQMKVFFIGVPSSEIYTDAARRMRG
jgi:hypothetical protein